MPPNHRRERAGALARVGVGLRDPAGWGLAKQIKKSQSQPLQNSDLIKSLTTKYKNA